MNEPHSKLFAFVRIKPRRQSGPVIRYRKLDDARERPDADNDVALRVFHRIGDRLADEKPERDPKRRRQNDVRPGDDDRSPAILLQHQIGEIAAQALEIKFEVDALLAVMQVQSPVHPPESGHATGRDGQLCCRFRRRGCEALQGEQAHDHLQAVAEPVLELLRHQVLLLSQNAQFTQQFLFAQQGSRQFGASIRLAGHACCRRKRRCTGAPKLRFGRDV